MTDQNNPVFLQHPQKNQAVEVLIKAFQDDPMYLYLIPDAGKRVQVLRVLWGGLINYTLTYGEIYTTPAVEGVACWLSPGNTKITFWRMLRAGFGLARSAMKLGAEERRKFFATMNYVDDLHKRLVPEHHWYLWALGVTPELQGQGIGSRLMAPVLEKSIAEGLPCYLETDTEDNVIFYQKRGFEVANKGNVPGQDLTLWTMLRKPQ